MTKKTLSDEERSLLLHCLTKHKPELVEKLDQLDSGLLDPDMINQIRVAVGLELMDKGFKPDWEPNEYGFMLEDLIAELGNLYLWPERKGG